ncbi:MAG: hypothetical protein MRZ79_16165 [Bacteroidia bacterium]|nr:hypothetical protein [Bacteroidia bacterium]
MKMLDQIRNEMKLPELNDKLESMSLRQKIAQFIHVPAWSNRGEAHLQELQSFVEDYEIGGVVFFQGDPINQSEWTASLQQLSKIPLLISMDAEWGLGMRLSESPAFPYQMTLGAIENDQLIFEMGKEIGRQLRQIGVHINFAPVVDINTQAQNPVIGFRSFGSDPQKIINKAWAYAQGLEATGVMPVIKHFPGHGDTKLDSHLALPVLDHPNDRLESVELLPFKALIEKGIPAVMSSHLHIPAWDARKSMAVTHSDIIIHQKLRQKLNFDGLLFTDALDMKAVSAFMTPAEINREAFLAGHDVLLFCVDVPGSIAEIEKSVEKGTISEGEIDRRCLKALACKQLLNFKPSTWDGDKAFVQGNIHSAKLASASISLLKGELPSIENHAIELLSIDLKGKSKEELAHHQLGYSGGRKYIPMEWSKTFWKEHNFWEVQSTPELPPSNSDKELIVYVHGLNLKAKNQFGLGPEPEVLDRLEKLLEKRNCHLVWMGSPYALTFVKHIKRAQSILLTYQEGLAFEKGVAAILTGEKAATGNLPVSLGFDWG